MSADDDDMTLSFCMHIPFISFSCLSVLARVSRTMMNKSGDGGVWLDCGFDYKNIWTLTLIPQVCLLII